MPKSKCLSEECIAMLTSQENDIQIICIYITAFKGMKKYPELKLIKGLEAYTSDLYSLKEHQVSAEKIPGVSSEIHNNLISLETVLVRHINENLKSGALKQEKKEKFGGNFVNRLISKEHALKRYYKKAAEEALEVLSDKIESLLLVDTLRKSFGQS